MAAPLKVQLLSNLSVLQLSFDSRHLTFNTQLIADDVRECQSEWLRVCVHDFHRKMRVGSCTALVMNKKYRQQDDGGFLNPHWHSH